MYSSAEFDQEKLESTIQRYTDLRLKECLLNTEFAEKVRNGNNGHLYIKVLKEQIIDELAISQPAKASDFESSRIMNEDNLKTDVEGRYNLEDVSNLKSLGLEKLVGQEQSTLDRILADYFLNKRGQYVASNELLEQLDKQLGEKHNKLRDNHPGKTTDRNQTNEDGYPFNGEPNMAFHVLKSQVDKEVNPRIESSDLNALLELDIATA
jgi:hypothetical protein